jgi:hypothetical protein
VSCSVWPLATCVNFGHVKFDLTLVSKLKVPLQRFPLSRKDKEDDTHFRAKVEQEARNIVGSYTCMEHEAYVACVPNNGRLNCVLEVAEVAYVPHPVPVFAEVLKKRKADAIVKVSAKRPKVAKKKGAEPAKVSGARRVVRNGHRCGHPAGKVHKAEQGYCTPHNCFDGRSVHYA